MTTKPKSGSMTRRRTKPSPAPAYPKVIETYREPRQHDLEQTEPSAFNGEVRIRRYRVTVELIEEPIDVLRDRLRQLWRTEEPMHHRWEPMREMAATLGMNPNELDIAVQGIDYPRRKS